MNEKVSIVIPVYNASKFISDTILSVKSQTYTNWELILVDDGSTDDGLSIMKELAAELNAEKERVFILELGGNQKAARARNAGVQKAEGRYLAFLDADDLWDPEKLAKQVAMMQELDCAFSFTGYEFADEDGIGVQKIVHVPEKINYRKAVKNTTIFTSTVMFDLEKLDKTDIEMPLVPSEDTATWWKVLKKIPYAYGLDEDLTLYRRGGTTLSSNKLEAVKRTWNLYRNVEHFGLVRSAYCFCCYLIHAIIRRV
ncbi:MAG: glycosyltransferase family 2 protein [Lachnospiraceae bacterium]|nr:glycosyltransferase family 2 protein [Lachnospiraceae bacterium]